MKFGLTILNALILVFSVYTAQAQVAYPKFQKHYVVQGETAAAIAAKFNVSLTDFCLLNDFPKDVKLQAGQLVLIKQLAAGEQEIIETPPMPTKAGHVKYDENAIATYEKTEPVKETSKPAPVKETAKPAPTKEPVTTSKPKAAEEPVVIPPPSTKAVEVGPGGTKYNVSQSGTHTVQKGQTFYRIALIYGMSVQQLQELNGLSNTNIEVGQVLKVKK